MKIIMSGLLAALAGTAAVAHPLDGAPGLFDKQERSEPAKRNDELVMRGAAFNRLLAKAGSGFYKPVTVCRGDGDRDVVVGGQGRQGDTIVGNLEVIDRAQCPKRANSQQAQGK